MGKTSREQNEAYYNALSASTDAYWRYMAAPRLRFRRIVNLARCAAPSFVCDFGCGNGNLLLALRGRLPHSALAGIDLAGERIARNASEHPDILWARADLAASDFAYPLQRLADFAVSSEVLEHVDAPELYLRNILGSMEAGGMLVLTTQSGVIRSTERHVGHVRHWEATELASLLRRTGFVDVRVWNEGFPFHDLSKWIANRNPEKTLRSFGAGGYGLKQHIVCLGLRFLFLFNSRSRGAQLFATARRSAPAEV